MILGGKNSKSAYRSSIDVDTDFFSVGINISCTTLSTKSCPRFYLVAYCHELGSELTTVKRDKNEEVRLYRNHITPGANKQRSSYKGGPK